MKIDLFRLLPEMVVQKFKTVKKFVIKMFNFVIIYLYGTENQFAIFFN